MLCRDERALSRCEVEAGDRGVVVRIRVDKRGYELDLSSATALTYEELSGRLLVVLASGRTVEIQPQSLEDLDTVSRLLAFHVISRNPPVVDLAGRVLKGFCRAACAMLRLLSALREAERGIDWGTASRLVEEVISAIGSDEHLRASLSEKEVYSLEDSVSGQDIRGAVSSVRNLMTSLYRSAEQILSRVLPGTLPEVLLDAVLVGVLGYALRSFELPLSEGRAASLEEVTEFSLGRFAKIVGAGEPLLRELANSLRTKRDAEEIVDAIVSVLKRSFATPVPGSRGEARQA